MCGIGAILAFHGKRPSKEAFARMIQRLRPRGPDGEGVWSSPGSELLLGHTRLAILDPTPRAAQPMVDPETGNVLAFNGEIYNFRELRRELESQGCAFRTESDTEVLLALYRHRGLDMLGSLRGMFAFLLWDATSRSLICVRDPLGIKPLYVASGKDRFYAASQVRALLATHEVDSSPEPAGHVGFFLWGAVPEPFSLFRSIRTVEPGTLLQVSPSGEVETKPFFKLVSLWRSNPPGASSRRIQAEAHTKLRAALHSTVAAHRVSDVPVGVFLSAGRDSTAIAALTAELADAPVAALTLGIEEWRNQELDEVPLAAAIAEQLGFQHAAKWVDRTTAEQLIEGFLAAMDQPTTDGLNTYLIAAAAREAGWKVALSGLGGDELFHGYPSFSDVPSLVRFGRTVRRIPGARSVAHWLVERLGSVRNPKFSRAIAWSGSLVSAYILRRALFLPEWLTGAFEPEFLAQGWTDLAPERSLETLLLQAGSPADSESVGLLESSLYLRHQLLRDTDWASLCHGIEVRVPFVDLELWRAVRSLEGSSAPFTKRNLVQAAGAASLPGQQRRRKTGFGLPLKRWFPEAWMRYPQGAPYPAGLRPWALWIYEKYAGGARNAPWLGWRSPSVLT